MNRLSEPIKKSITTVKIVARSTKGKNILLYLMCVCVAFVFWVFLSLDMETQRDFEIPVELDHVPDSVVMIGDMPAAINTVVQGKGSQLLRFMWGSTPVMKINYEDYGKNNVLSLSRPKLESRLRDYFGQGVRIVSLRPDSLHVKYTTEEGKRVKLKLNTDIKTKLQYILSGPIKTDVDSVMIYSTSDIPGSITSVDTEMLVKTELTDTTVYEIAVKPIPGMRIIPDHITVTVPVEPLISKHRTIPIEVVNLPEGIGLITFPSAIEITYLVPMSSFNNDYPLKAFVDFNTIKRSSSFVKVNMASVPDMYHSVSLSRDSVEYIIETRQK